MSLQRANTILQRIPGNERSAVTEFTYCPDGSRLPYSQATETAYVLLFRNHNMLPASAMTAIVKIPQVKEEIVSRGCKFILLVSSTPGDLRVKEILREFWQAFSELHIQQVVLQNLRSICLDGGAMNDRANAREAVHKLGPGFQGTVRTVRVVNV